ncbi:MmcQ/YjbR family DNA-binding protein [Nocardioides sp. LS1]|uniref:MmcQ/YjbR family DNA-binding protein n=1 Tax=Nocardioides sp. LS1 TaxID=1027620 RepID=UPI001C8BDC71|nr:MmcQ/YjbR family DNA-binding protein [Nocardioides sp. LS1]
MSAYRDVTGVAEPTTVLTFRSSGDELLALAHAGPPFYRPPWSSTVVGMVLDDDTDWGEVAELVTESYRFCAPQKLRHRLDR